jgi:predicted GIY-YIG superfamily endonuclease
MTDTDWVCYLLTSLTTNRTYIGSSNDQPKRLEKHNSGRGAKYTRGQTWIPIIVVSGFDHKNTCLSFESGWKRLSKTRSNAKLSMINEMSGLDLKYTTDSRWNRIMDLLYFVHHFTLLDTKFKMNYHMKYPIIQPEELHIDIFMEEWIERLPWPHFIVLDNK